ncbi:MAG: methyltransferase domain-containing protein [Microcystaceae cyanobacterium]
MSNNLYQQIQDFYDASSQLWETTWGEHMHHGYYGRQGKYKVNRRQAQIDLIEELLSWSGVKTCYDFVDIGCGIGGSTLYLANKYNAVGQGITLSPVQAERAGERAINDHLEQQVTFQVADALNMPFEDNQFDLVWSLESGEHMPDKAKFLQECYRVLKPNGTFILATWCHRPTTSLAGELTPDEQKHLAEIYRVYYLPYVISLPEYEQIASDCGFQEIKTDDWSISVAPFWNEVINSALDISTLPQLLKSDLKTFQGALSLNLMSRGYERGLIRFGILCGTKKL